MRCALAAALAVGLGAFVPVSAAAPAPGLVVAAEFTFVPGDTALPVDTLVVQAGQGLQFANLDSVPHNVTADADASGNVAFHSPTVTVSNTINRTAPVPVYGVETLAPGTYLFHCAVHPTVMHGRLVVQ